MFYAITNEEGLHCHAHRPCPDAFAEKTSSCVGVWVASATMPINVSAGILIDTTAKAVSEVIHAAAGADQRRSVLRLRGVEVMVTGAVRRVMDGSRGTHALITTSWSALR